MKTITNTHTSTKKTQSAPKAKSIKLGIDVHADSYRVVRQLDHATPQPAQKFTPQGFLLWARQQLELAEAVRSRPFWLRFAPRPGGDGHSQRRGAPAELG